MNEAVFALTVLAWLAYLASRLFRRQVPELVAFLFVGAVLGPSVLGILTEESIIRLQPVVEGALAVLMFVIGERISVRALRGIRWMVPAGVLSFALTGVAMYFVGLEFGGGRPTALMLAAIAGAGAPMTVASLVASAKARGKYADGLVGTHALADGLAATTFAAVLPIAEFIAGPGSDIGNAATRFLKLGVGGVLLGLFLGWVIARLGQQIETSGELLLFALIHLLVAQTAASALDLSLPLAAIVMGATVGTLSPTDHSQRVFTVVRTIEQPLFLLFFALAGASIHLEEIPELGALGAAYVITRLIGKFVGGFLGGSMGRLPWRTSIRLGGDLIPQAGVAVGLAVLAAEALPGSGGRVATVVLGSVVVFELAGSLLVNRSLRAAPTTVEDGEAQVRDALDGIPKRVLVASRSHVEAPGWLLDAASRWGSDLVVLGRGREEDARVENLRGQARARLVSFRWIPLKAESFTGAVVRTARDVEADLVVVITPPARLGFESRLVLLPHERIARELSSPVLLVPLEPTPVGKVTKTAPQPTDRGQPARPADAPVRSTSNPPASPPERVPEPGPEPGPEPEQVETPPTHGSP